MKTTTRTIAQLLEKKDSPLPLEVIPNQMGINLCNVESLTWTKQDDGQLVRLAIRFIPATVEVAISQGKGEKEHGATTKPTIAELEAILDKDEETAIHILPNGEIRATGKESGTKKPLTLREDLGGEYKKEKAK